MKKTYFILIVLLISIPSFSQSKEDIGKISLSIVMPENLEYLNFSQLSMLETKITAILTSSGIAATGYNNNFVVYPKFAIYESNVVEGGIQNITIVSAELSLFIKQVDNNLLFATINKPIKGSGSSKSLAITNAISKIQINDPDFKVFIETGKSKIISYYEANCYDIIQKSESFAKLQKYDYSFGLLMSVPDGISSCKNKIQEKAIEVYRLYQSHICSELIQKAKTTLAKSDYIGALNIISEIDPSTNCYKEAQLIAKYTEKQLKDEEKKQWNFQMQQYNDEVGLAKYRIEAIKQIAVSYYKSQRKNVTYNYLIK